MGKQVSIPFMPEWKDKMLGGEKVCTSRTRRYGDVGSRFEAFGVVFEITAMERCALESVASYLYRSEGCASRNEFVDVWERLHPRAGWRPAQRVWVHWFKRLGV